MNDPQFDGLSDRVTRIETQMKDVREDVRELRREDIKAIRVELRQLHDEISAGQKGMSRGEKLTLAGVSAAVLGTLVTVITVLSNSPTP